jgi:hypothetical protein
MPNTAGTSSGAMGKTSGASTAASSAATAGGGAGGSMDDIDLRNSSVRGSTGTLNKLNAGYTANYNSKNNELKRIWQSVLRECHRSDPERCGQVSRNVFIAALEKSDVDKVCCVFVSVFYVCLSIFTFLGKAVCRRALFIWFSFLRLFFFLIMVGC